MRGQLFTPSCAQAAQDRPTLCRLAAVLRLGPCIHTLRFPGSRGARTDEQTFKGRAVSVFPSTKYRRGKAKILHHLPLLRPLQLSLILAKSASRWSQKTGTHNTRTWNLSHSPLSCSLQSPSPCKPANPLHHACPCNKNSGLRAWHVNSSGPTGLISLSSPTLQVWCLISRVCNRMR